MTVATLFTLLRIALIPVFGWLWARGEHEVALWAFGIAAVSDLLDGLLARALDQRTRLGALLDPAADKLMLLVSFLVAASVGAVPWWLAGLVIGRDLVLTAGSGLLALVLRDRFDSARLPPTRIGKYATVLEALTIGLALLASARLAPSVRPWVPPLVLATAVFALIAGAQYSGRAIMLLRERPPTQPAARLPGAHT